MSNMKISQWLWHRFMLRVSCSCHTRTGAFYHSMPMIGDQALTRSRGCCVNVVQSPTAYANFHTGSPVALANYSDPELDRLLEHARSTADLEKRTEDYCAISRLVNKEASIKQKAKGSRYHSYGLLTKLAKTFGVTRECIVQIDRRRIWRSINRPKPKQQFFIEVKDEHRNVKEPRQP